VSKGLQVATNGKPALFEGKYTERWAESRTARREIVDDCRIVPRLVGRENYQKNAGAKEWYAGGPSVLSFRIKKLIQFAMANSTTGITALKTNCEGEFHKRRRTGGGQTGRFAGRQTAIKRGKLRARASKDVARKVRS